MPRLAHRTNDFLTFRVMELFKQAQALQAAGKDIISLGIGEPDFTAPPQVVEALERAARSGLSGYSPTAGCPRCARPSPASTSTSSAPASIPGA